ncbi:hypothetical protein [Desulfospira joergensenii]|uniref:hypothetical protein n=1 Tax=Desulfospira joergensenii TaxID=53329 RepID=UPI0003B34042|nr:hypothetical protein [Desulfospira joergensenii]
MKQFKANSLPLLIGSLPMDNHKEATDLVFEHTPEIPLWVQLPMYRQEGMIDQFLPGLPGLARQEDKLFLDTQKEEFDPEFLAFFEEYLTLSDPGADLKESRFAFDTETGKGFFEFLRQVDERKGGYPALKGQVTGPITFATSVKDENNRDIFYNDQLRDAALKKLALNARWQAREFKKRTEVPIIFMDEPALAGFGTSAYITITQKDVKESLEEIAREIHAEDGLAGVHVCANTEWDMLLSANIDIISFDAFSYFDRFILYPDRVRAFLEKGGILAWGIVPTANAEEIAAQTVEGLVKKLEGQIRQVTDLGISRDKVLEQIFITPSCGTGSLDLESAKKVLFLTREVSKIIRSE